MFGEPRVKAFGKPQKKNWARNVRTSEKSSKRAIAENTQEELKNKEKGTEPRSSDIE